MRCARGCIKIQHPLPSIRSSITTSPYMVSELVVQSVPKHSSASERSARTSPTHSFPLGINYQELLGPCWGGTTSEIRVNHQPCIYLPSGMRGMIGLRIRIGNYSSPRRWHLENPTRNKQNCFFTTRGQALGFSTCLMSLKSRNCLSWQSQRRRRAGAKPALSGAGRQCHRLPEGTKKQFPSRRDQLVSRDETIRLV
jgi:hypothetical protein